MNRECPLCGNPSSYRPSFSGHCSALCLCLSLTDLREDGVCWRWNGGFVGKLPVITNSMRGQLSARKCLYEARFGIIEEGKNIVPHCDTFGCVNPNHMYSGTRRQALRSRESKRRSLAQRVNLKKLSLVNMWEIYELTGSWLAISRRYKTNFATVRYLKTCEEWMSGNGTFVSGDVGLLRKSASVMSNRDKGLMFKLQLPEKATV